MSTNLSPSLSADTARHFAGLPRSGPLHLLVTAGPTREKIDEVRDWGNIFTGKTGLDLALAFLELGNVTLLTSNRDHARDYDGYSGKGGMLGVETFHSHGQLHDLLREQMAIGGIHVAAMTAAVSDYRPAGAYRVVARKVADHGKELWEVEDVSAAKVKSSHERIAVLGERTLKLVDQFRTAWGFQGLLIKFKLEVGLSDEELIQVAGASRLASGADLMVANTLAMARGEGAAGGGGEGGGGGGGGAYLIDDHGPQRVGRPQLAQAITTWVRNGWSGAGKN